VQGKKERKNSNKTSEENRCFLKNDLVSVQRPFGLVDGTNGRGNACINNYSNQVPVFLSLLPCFM